MYAGISGNDSLKDFSTSSETALAFWALLIYIRIRYPFLFLLLFCSTYFAKAALTESDWLTEIFSKTEVPNSNESRTGLGT